ncbi:MAG: phospho-sugar mutase [Rhodothermaceae bacterium]|nr:phospho-sugar mutase [Rhodothermaceae bacterium]
MTNVHPDAAVAARINKWLEGNYDAGTKAAIRRMLDEKRFDELTDAFYRDLEFGTGGLRGIMGHGTNRVNRYTIGMATQGLSNYLKKVYPGEQIRVVIAHDNRNNGVELARVTAGVFSANGFRVFFFDALRPTPELSFAIRELNCHSGVMLTASHNPREYNGYKAYWRDGGQVIAPHDKNIIAEVSKVDSIDKVKFEAVDENISMIGSEMDRLYIARLLKTTVRPDVIREQNDLNIVFSPIHGAAVKLVPDTLRAAGFTNVNLVEEQCITDGNFPTVVYPNPEEEEAMTLALRMAETTGADLVMATDPDADRVGVAVKNGSGGYTLLNGNQTGSLLIHYLLEAWRDGGRMYGNEYVVKTIVTTGLIDKIAASMDVTCYNVLTGFKYIGALMTELEGKEHFIAGGEESYGYLIGDHVRDKDAVVACLAIAEMTACYKSQGKTLIDALTGIYLEYGLYREKLISLTKKGKAGAAEIRALMESFRKNPPAELGGEKIALVRDYISSTERNIATGIETKLDFPSSNVLQFITETGSVISARPSGTEPKIKFYISVKCDLPEPDLLPQKNDELENRIDTITRHLAT